MPEPTQAGLILHILCGFSVAEVTAAFLSSEAATQRRIARAKGVLARSKALFNLEHSGDVTRRLLGVQRALYLLFNEGYHGASSESPVRAQLCGEAMRLTRLLQEHPLTATPASYALLALMCLHGARVPARVDSRGRLTSLTDQDRSLWDRKLIVEGRRLLEQSATGDEVSEYHVEAAIAELHARARGAEDTDWREIVSLYDRLLEMRPSPVVALNRAIAVAQLEGPEKGLDLFHTISDRRRLVRYPFYAAAMGELELWRGKPRRAQEHFRAALTLARGPMERRYFEQRAAACEPE